MGQQPMTQGSYDTDVLDKYKILDGNASVGSSTNMMLAPHNDSK